MTTMSASPSPGEDARFAGPLAAAWPDDVLTRALDALPARADLGIPAAEDRAAWSALDPATLAALREQAEAERGTPWPQPLASDFARYFRDGNRTAYEGAVGARQRRLTRAVVLAAATDETALLDEAADGVQLICEQSGWSWAAHDDTRARHGHVVPTASDPYLDLGAGEIAAQLAWVDQVLGGRLDERAPGITARMRHETRLRVFTPFLTRRDWWWLGLDGDLNNWNPWIHGNIVAAALRLAPDAATRDAVLRLALDGLDRFLASLPPDGAIDEGFSYWWNGAGRALEALETLRTATGGALDAAGVPVVRETLRFPLRMQLAGDWYVNVADGRGRAPAGLPWHVPHGWGLRTGQPDVVAHAASHRRPGGPVGTADAGLGRLLHALFDPAWAAAAPARPPLPRHTRLESTEVLVVREREGDAAGFALAVKGGHNGEHHNHKDLGEVIVAHDGVPVLVDAGQPTYTAQTFGPDRYAIRAMRSSWHSAPAPWGLEQGEGAGFAAVPAGTIGGADEPVDGIALRLEGAYPLAGAAPGSGGARWLRTAVLDRGAHRIRIRDEWDLAPCPGGEDGILVHHLIHGEVRLETGSDAALILPAGGGAVRLRWDCARPVIAETREWMLDDPLLTAVWGPRLTCLTLRIAADPGRGDRGDLTVTLEGARR